MQREISIYEIKCTAWNTSQVDESSGAITVDVPNADKASDPPRTFTFDTVFGQNCKQVDIYNEVARPIVECILEGYNGLLEFDIM